MQTRWQTKKKMLCKLLLLFAMIGFGFWFLITDFHQAVGEYFHIFNNSDRLRANGDGTYNEEMEESFKLLDLTQEDMARIKREMMKRRARVKDICRQKGMLSTNWATDVQKYGPVITKLIIDVNHNVTWCPIYKAGSSFFMELFAKMSGKMTSQKLKLLQQGKIQMNNLARNAYQPMQNVDTSLKAFNATNRFIIVRHPFERLLSAYRDKLEHRRGREYFYNKYGKTITWFYRHHRYIRNRTDAITGEQKQEPTFLEFLHFIVEKRIFDEHWKPYIMECIPCFLDYSHIVKMESFNQDVSYLINSLQLKTFLPSRQIKYSKNLKKLRDIVKHGNSLAHLYYSQIPTLLLQKIYLLYEADFILFNYSPEIYFHMTKKSI